MASTETRRIQFDFVARDRGVRRTTEETGAAVEGMNEQVEGGSGKMGKLGAVAAKLGPILGTVAGAAALVGPAIAKGLDAQAATAKMQAQLGVTAKESQRIGGVAGKLYSSAYGESMDEVRTAITSVIRNMDGMANASSSDLKATTARAMDLAQVMGEDVSRVTAGVSQMMRTGLAKNSKEAFDIMTRGAQLGANKAEDLADTMEEYGVQFKNMGLDGKASMGLIVQGLQAGGRNADLVADTIKEFSIEAVAGGERVSKGFKSLGLDAKEMSAAFGRGGPSAAKALDIVLDRLRSIKDPVKRNQVAIELFGTKAEDMGKALYALDPSEATKKLGNLAGATDRAGQAMGNTAKAKLTAFKRTLETQVTNAAGRALNALGRLGGQVAKGFKMPAGGKAANDFQRLGQMARQVANVFQQRVVPAGKTLFNWFSTKIVPILAKFHREVLKEVVKQVQRVAKEVDKNEGSFRDLFKVIGKIIEIVYKTLGPVMTFLYKVVLKLLGTAISWQIKLFGFLIGRLRDTWRRFQDGRRIISEWAKGAGRAFSGFRDIATRALATVVRRFLDMVSTLVRGAARAFGWVPGIGGKLKNAAKEFDKFKDRVNRSLEKLRDRTDVKVNVSAKGSWHSKQQQQWYARGGRVWSSDPDAREAYDSVPAMLRLNEHVWTPEEVRAVGGHDAMYRMREAARRGLLHGYATGGPVGVNPKTKLPSSKELERTTWKPIDTGMWGLFLGLARMLYKMFGGANGVVGAARSQVGRPYSWGGGGKGGPSYGIGRGAGTYGFDCSGLTEYAWWKGAKVDIGGTTYTQWPNSRPSSRRPGALGFPHMDHVVVASDKPGYIIQAPYTGSYVQEVRSGRNYSWRWPKGAKFAVGGAVERFGEEFVEFGGTGATRLAKLAGIASDPGRRRQNGGPVAAGQPYLVGEAGAEVFTPRAVGTVHSTGTKVVNVTQNITVKIEAAPGTNKAELGRELNDCLLAYKKNGGQLAVRGH